MNPWHSLRDLGPTWVLRWSDDLPDDMYGKTDFWERVITLREGMSFEERRCTIAHELEHIRRGPTSKCAVLMEEAVVDRTVARYLLPCVRQVVDEMVWHRGDYEMTSEGLWVDPWTLEVRLATLEVPEQAYLLDRLADVVVSVPH